MAAIPRIRFRRSALVALGLGMAIAASLASAAPAAPVEPVHSLAAAQKAPLIETLRSLVSIESGSGDRQGLDRIADVIAGRLKALGGAVETIEPDPADIYRMVDTPKQIGKMVQARFTGTGTKKIMLIAHMDTVYLRGMLAQQPFRIDGNRAYGLGIADDKHGVALILHALAILKAMDFRDYGLITVLINGDEEVSSAGSRATLTRLGGAHDVVFSCEGARVDSDRLSLTTPASRRWCSTSRAAPRTQARRRNAGATRSTSSRTRSCRPAICRTRNSASR
jgi:glutamate carboxypeptidase